MKTIIYTLSFSFLLILANEWNIFSQGGGTGLQTDLAKAYMQKSDSADTDNASKTEAGILLRSHGIDSLLQVREQKRINRMYLGDSNALQNKSELDALVQQLKSEKAQIQEQAKNGYTYQKKNLDSVLSGKVNAYKEQVKNLDSLKLKYEYMLAHQGEFTNAEITALNGEVEKKQTQLDSMLQARNQFCYEYRKQLDSLKECEQKKLDSMLMKKQGEIDEIFGIAKQAKFKISQKTAAGDSALSQNKKKLSDVVEEVVIIDETKIRMKFAYKVKEPQEIKNLFKISLGSTLKSVSATAIEITDVTWASDRSDIVQLTTSEPITNPDIIEIEYEGEVELSGSELILKSTTTAMNTIQINKVTIYPNPAVDYIKISNSENITSAMIYNISGMLVQECSTNVDMISVSNLPNGIYVLKMKNASGDVVIEKFEKK